MVPFKSWQKFLEVITRSARNSAENILKINHLVRHVDLSKIYYISTDLFIEKILTACPMLEKLHLDSPLCFDHKWFRLISRCSKLKELRLVRCYSITDEDMKNLFKALDQLTLVDLTCCRSIEGEFLEFIPSNLRFLILDYCPKIRIDHFERLSNVSELTVSIKQIEDPHNELKLLRTILQNVKFKTE